MIKIKKVAGDLRAHLVPTLGILGVLLLVALVVINPDEGWFGERKETILFAGYSALVIVTAVYAYHTHTMVKATKKLADAAREQMQEGLRPVVELRSVPLRDIGKNHEALSDALTVEVDGRFPEHTYWRFINHGPGPALNVQYLIRDLNGSRWQDEKVLPVRDETRYLPLLLQDSETPGEKYVAAAYEDVYGRKWESKIGLRIMKVAELRVGEEGPLPYRLVIGPLKIRPI